MPIVAPNKESKIGENILEHDLDEGEVHNPMNRVKILTGQHTHRDLAEAQIEGVFAFSRSGYSHNASSSSKQACTGPKPLDCAPPQTIRVVKFPKEKIKPILVWKQTVDVTADKHQGDAKLGHIPDFREDWGDGERWELYRRACYVYVAPKDIPEVKLHGWYVIFATYDPGYDKNTHKLIAGYGRHIHEDIFIAKIGTYPDADGWTVYVDMPDEFLSTTTESGRKVYEINLSETNNYMMTPLLGW